MKITDYTKQQIISLLEVLDIEFDRLHSKSKLFNLLQSNEKKLEEIRLGTFKPIEHRTILELDKINIDIESNKTHLSIGYFDSRNTNSSCFVDMSKGHINKIYKEDGSYIDLASDYRFYVSHRDLSIKDNIINLKVSDLYPHFNFTYGNPAKGFNVPSVVFILNESSNDITDIKIKDVPLTSSLDLKTMGLKADLNNLGTIPFTKATYRKNNLTGFATYVFPYTFQSYPIIDIYTGLDKISIKLESLKEFKSGKLNILRITDKTLDKESISVLSHDISPELIRCPEVECICPDTDYENIDEGSTFDDEIDLDDKFCGRLNPTYPRNRKKQIDKVVTRGESFVGADTVRRRDGSWEQCPPCDIQTYTEQKFDDDGSFLQRTNYASVDDDGNYDWFECHPKDCTEATPLKYNTPDSMEKEIENKRNLIDELIAIRSKGNPNERKMSFDDELARRRGDRLTGESFEVALAKRQSKHRL